MYGMNKVFLLGHLGQPPQQKSSSGGKSFVQLRVATHRTVFNKLPSDSTPTADWHSVFVWGKQAENCLKYLQKGHPVMIEGYLSSFTQENPDTGEKKHKTAINALKVDFLHSKSKGLNGEDQPLDN